MAWLAQYPESNEIKRQAEKALSLQLGLASPLWLAFGAAASVGVTWWWMTRWSAATNLEAVMAPPAPTAFTPKLVATIEPATVEIVAVEPVVVAAAAPLIEAAPDIAPVVVDEPVLDVVPVVSVPVDVRPAVADDLTRLVGIGPKVADALAARGVTQFAQLAAWTDEDLAKFDAELKLLGRGTRDAWIAQAKRLAADA
jgi:predicted flap endonuclease-1-like 5' DNA nuclease